MPPERQQDQNTKMRSEIRSDWSELYTIYSIMPILGRFVLTTGRIIRLHFHCRLLARIMLATDSRNEIDKEGQDVECKYKSYNPFKYCSNVGNLLEVGCDKDCCALAVTRSDVEWLRLPMANATSIKIKKSLIQKEMRR